MRPCAFALLMIQLLFALCVFFFSENVSSFVFLFAKSTAWMLFGSCLFRTVGLYKWLFLVTRTLGTRHVSVFLIAGLQLSSRDFILM